MLRNDGLEESGEVGSVGARVEGSIACQQKFKRRQEGDIELETIGARPSDGVERQDVSLGSDGEVDCADGESGLAAEEWDTRASALAVAVPEDADHAALAQRPQCFADAGLGRREKLDAGGSTRGVDRFQVSGVIKPLDQRHCRDVERCQRLDRNLRIRDVRGGQDHATSGLVGVEQVVQSLNVEMSVKHSLRGDCGQEGEVNVVSGGFGDDFSGVAVELGGRVLGMDALEIVADADALPLQQRKGERGCGLGEGVEGGSREKSGEPGKDREGSGGRHVGMFSREYV